MRKHTFFERFAKCANQSMFSFTFFGLRLVIGFVFLYAGISKLGDWSAAGYLAGATGPLADWFQSLAGNGLVDALNVWGAILIGACLMLGLLARPASFFGIIMMILYYFSDFVGNTAHGLIDEHIIYSIVLLLFISGGVGHIFGLDGLIHENLRKKRKYLDFLFG